MEDEAEKLIEKLNNIYKQMPDTIGCVSCGKCCRVQHPHCYFIEFINMYRHIVSSWSQKETSELIALCVERYISNDLEKPCVFLDEKNMCKIYHTRNYNCRAFGIIPKKVYAKRVREVKKNFPGVRLGLEKQTDCCGGVKPKTFIGAKKLDGLFEQIYNLDIELGVSPEDLAAQNNYMTFHDHLLLFLYGNNPQFLNQLTEVKRHGSEKDKVAIMTEIRREIEEQKDAE